MLFVQGVNFQRVRTVTEKAWVPEWLLTLGIDIKWKPDERSSLDFGARERIANKYECSPEERVW